MSNTLKQYPYQNLSLDDIEGEEWDDVPGLDSYFLISSFGRIKRQQYETQYKNGSIHLKPEKIIKPKIGKARNNFKNDYTYYLWGKVVLNGTSHILSIPRIVYHCFIEPFDLEDHQTVILCKDTDNFNVHPSNLVKATRHEKQQRVIARERFRTPLIDLTEDARLKNRQAILQTVRKQVTQYSLNGRKIKTYNSLSEAQRATGAFVTEIGRVASGKQISAGGFIWRWDDDAEVDVATLRQEKRRSYIDKNGQKVTQYDLSGKKINQFASVKDAAEATGVRSTGIYMVLAGKYRSMKGFFWAKGYGEDFIDLKNINGEKTNILL